MKKIVIIGAGPAGITAGVELIKLYPDYDITIIEESNEIGGISKTVKHNGNRMDIGGHRFFSKDAKVNKWWNDIMPMQGKPSFDDILLNREMKFCNGGPDPEKSDIVMLKRHRVSRIYYNNKFFDYPVKMNKNTIMNMGLSNTAAAGFSYLYSCVFKRKEDSLENFYINRFGKKLYSMFFEGYTEKLWGIHPRDISADWGAQRVKGLSIKAILKDIFIKTINGKNRKVETSLIEEFSYPKYGPGQLWEVAADKFVKLGGKIKVNSKVIKVNKKDNNIKSIKYLENGIIKDLELDILISSMPIKDLIESFDEVDEETLNIAKGLPYRDFVTLGILTDSLNIKNETSIKTLNNIIPDCWIYIQDPRVKMGRIQIFNNWSPYLVNNPENNVWLGLEYFCNEGDEFWNMSNENLIEFGINELLKMGIIDSKAAVSDSHCEKVKKAYPAYFGTYKDINKIVKYLDEIDNIYCIGRNGQHRYNNMDHSMVTAFETVNNIRDNIKNKNNIWSVNTEKEYHEENN